MALSLASLLLKQTKAQIYDFALGIARAVGLPVSSWLPGDPTRAQFHLESEILAALEDVAVGFISSGFLDYATKEWLKVLAEQVFGVVVPPAVAATTDVVLTNNGGGFYPGIEPGDLTFRSSLTGKTYRNTSGGDLASGPGTTLTVSVIADEPGSDSSAGAGEIDEMVTTLLGVTCSNPTAAIGVDEQSEATTRQQCRDKLGSLSPNGPREAYAFVARNPDLTGTNAVTRAPRVYADSDTGDVLVYLAGPTGSIAEVDRAKVEAAILKWATPLCITPTVLSASPVVVPITYELWVYRSVNKDAAGVQDDVLDALQKMFSERPIGGDIIPPANGILALSLIESTIRAVYPQIFRVAVTTPSSDVVLANSQVAALGAVTATINFVADS